VDNLSIGKSRAVFLELSPSATDSTDDEQNNQVIIEANQEK